MPSADASTTCQTLEQVPGGVNTVPPECKSVIVLLGLEILAGFGP
jgi:hypothetical protein